MTPRSLFCDFKEYEIASTRAAPRLAFIQSRRPQEYKGRFQMLTADAQTILSLLKTEGAMDGSDIETQTRLGELEIKKAAIELRNAGLIKTSGASDVHEDDGMAIDRLTITASGQRAR